MDANNLDELEVLLARLDLLATWRKPGGPTPKQEMPNTYKTVVAAAATIRAQAKDLAEMKAAMASICSRTIVRG